MTIALEQQSATPPRPGLIQLTKSGAEVSGSEAELNLLRSEFERQHWLLLPNFLNAPLLDLIQRKLSETEYRVVDRETGVELRPIDCTPYLANELLLNIVRNFFARSNN